MMCKAVLSGSGLAGAALTVAALVSSIPALGQSWPAKPIRVISPIGAGSAADILSRTFSEQLSALLGLPVIVENRPGAGGTLGVNIAAKAPADGYTILIHSNGHTIAPAVYPNLPYDPVADFTAVTTLGSFPNVLVVAPSKNLRTAQALAAAARSKPGSFNYASGGVGTPTHLAAERFRLSAAFEAQHVPFKGQVEALTETMTGRIDFYFCPVFPALPLIRDGKLLPLAVSSSKRVSSLPAVPTTLEAGFANSDFNFWVGMFVPANTPPALVKRLHEETLKTMQAPALLEKLAKLGVE
ncbi:MAG: tripartite tricarboxylate transporter substrate-binding protein, partial [Phycisphaerales bacterium]|nr:tripartite tricarboxylate transporter substrate-binding protein [Phycisphaerales bacterium]